MKSAHDIMETKQATSKTWTRTLDPGPGPWTRTLDLGPGPWTLTLKNLDPEKHGKQLDVEK